MLSCLWHPEASKVFYDYITSRTAFSDSRVQSSELWTTSITISHWLLRPARFPQHLSDIFDEMREQGEIPPRKVQESALGSTNVFRRLKERVQASTANERALEAHASSIVITGDHLGTFWICSVLSTLIDEDSVSRLVGEVKKLTELFIHRQSTGRRLSFIVLVGRLCANMAGEYDRIRDCLEKAVGVSVRQLPLCRNCLLIVNRREFSSTGLSYRSLLRPCWICSVWSGALKASGYSLVRLRPP